ncbi:hypothetical protein AAHC03_021110 [Spirometra sp. Aus1]
MGRQKFSTPQRRPTTFEQQTPTSSCTRSHRIYMEDNGSSSVNYSDRDHYNLCTNHSLKTTLGFGIFFQLTALCFGIAMLSVNSWVTISVALAGIGGDKYSRTRTFGPVSECFPSPPPGAFSPTTLEGCYLKNFGQYGGTPIDPHQPGLASAEVGLLAFGIIFNALALAMVCHLAVLWCRAPYDSVFMRNFRLVVGIVSTICTILYLATIVVYHLELNVEVKQIPQTPRQSVTLMFGSGYIVAWFAVATSLIAAWLFISSTCCWAVDFVNCRSVAAAFYPPCSQRPSPFGPNGTLYPAAYSMDSLSKWSIQDPPTLPRFKTATYGDGHEIRDPTSTAAPE